MFARPDREQSNPDIARTCRDVVTPLVGRSLQRQEREIPTGTK